MAIISAESPTLQRDIIDCWKLHGVHLLLLKCLSSSISPSQPNAETTTLPASSFLFINLGK